MQNLKKYSYKLFTIIYAWKKKLCNSLRNMAFGLNLEQSIYNVSQIYCICRTTTKKKQKTIRIYFHSPNTHIPTQYNIIT